MRALVLVLDVVGLALLVAAASITWGAGAGVAAIGGSCLVGALYADVTSSLRKKGRRS